MKKSVSLILALVLLFVPILSACGGSSSGGANSASDSSDKVYNLKLGTYLGTTNLVVSFFKYWANELENRTDGRVKVEVYAGSTLVPNGSELDAVVSGTLDIGHTSLTATPGRFPAYEATTLYYPQASGYATTMLRQDFYNEFHPEELADVHFLLAGNSGPNWLLFSKNVNATTKLDLTGYKMRAVGTMLVDFVNDNGGAAQSISLGELYDSLSKGIIDSLCQCIEALNTFNLYDFVDKAVRLPVCATGANGLVMNKELWESFPDDIKQIINELNEELIPYYGYVWMYADIIAEEKFLELGGTIIDVPEADAQAYYDYAAKKNAEYIDTYTNLPAAEYVSYMEERADYYEANPAGNEVVKAWVEENILPLSVG